MERNEIKFVREFESKWITESLDNNAIKYANDLGQYLKGNGFSTSQIRNVFGEVKRIQLNGFEENYSSFLLLQPKLAYAAIRSDKGIGARTFKDEINKAIRAVVGENSEKSVKRFNNFCQLFEAILAYHKAHGGK